MKLTNQKQFKLVQRGVGFGAIALSAMAVLLPACSPTNQPEETREPTAEETVTTGEVSKDTEELVGQTVTVKNEVTETVGSDSFLINDDRLLGGEDILVINASGAPLELPEGEDAEVQVTGEVRQFAIADVEQEYSLDLDPEVYTEYEEQPVIIAESIALAPKPEDIVENPEAYYNKVIAVEGEVEKSLSANTFTIDENELFGEEDLLVIGQDPNMQVDEGENVMVTGVLRPYVEADFDRDYDLTWDSGVKEQVKAEYSDRPVLVAEEVAPKDE